MKQTQDGVIGEPVNAEFARKLVKSQLAFLNTLSIQLQTDFTNIHSYDDDDPDIDNIDPDSEHVQHMESVMMASIYQRCRLIQKQLIDLKDWVQLAGIPDGKLQVQLGVSIRAATDAMTRFKSFCELSDAIDKLIDDSTLY